MLTFASEESPERTGLREFNHAVSLVVMVLVGMKQGLHSEHGCAVLTGPFLGGTMSLPPKTSIGGLDGNMLGGSTFCWPFNKSAQIAQH